MTRAADKPHFKLHVDGRLTCKTRSAPSRLTDAPEPAAAEFCARLLRLKEQLGLQSDKEVAAALGLHSRAFAARKARGSFPEDKLLALTARQPELRLDAVYVLTGRRQA